jgi:hypothetical protein
MKCSIYGNLILKKNQQNQNKFIKSLKLDSQIGDGQTMST